MRTLVGAIVLGACLVECGDNGVRPVDPDRSRQSPRTALDAWREGHPIATLAKQSPPIIVQDPDWEFGRTPDQFTVLDEGKDGAVDLRVPVELTLRGKPGPEVRKKVTYIIGTGPTITVFRRSFEMGAHDPTTADLAAWSLLPPGLIDEPSPIVWYRVVFGYAPALAVPFEVFMRTAGAQASPAWDRIFA